jgi:hypothetical protein
VSDGVFLDVSSDGIAAGHPQRVTLPKLVAPSTGAEFNTLQPHLITVGCALVPDHQFEFDSSFILPEATRAFRKLVRLINAKPRCPLSVFGHADPEGPDRYNKVLSGRRALAVYAVLVRDVQLWDELYGEPVGGDRWKTRSIQIMREAVGDASEGEPAPGRRKQLFLAYMDKLCTDADGQPFRVSKTDFVARGTDSGGKGDYQGCSEFNPVLLFSDKEHEEFKRAENRDARNLANAPNRRVLVLLFEEGTQVNPHRWPCPRARDESRDACRARFWSDGEARRSRLLPDKRRHFQESRDTFACRFYHGLAAPAPCEAALKLWVVRLLIDGPNGKRVPLTGRRFAVIAGDTANAPILRGITDDQGILRVPVYDDVVTMTLKLDASGLLFTPPQGSQSPAPSASAGQPGAVPQGAWDGEDTFRQFTLKGGALLPIDAPGYDPATQRLANLGYGNGDSSQWDTRVSLFAIQSFQRTQHLTESGAITGETLQKVRQEYGS